MRTFLILAFAATTFVACGGETGGDSSPGQSPGARGQDFSPVIARVGDVEITQSYFDYRYEQLPPQDKARYSGEGWQQRFLDDLVEETLLFRQAEEDRYDLVREVEYRLDMARRSILRKAYYDRKFRDELVVPEERIVEYYEENPEGFRSLARALGYHIQTSSKERIDEAHAALQKGETFAVVAARYSEDENTKDNGGLLGWFNPGSYVLGMGENEEFTDFAFSLAPQQVSEPVKIGDTWHIVRLGAKTEEEIQPFESVRDRIERQLHPIIAREAYEKHLRELEKAWDVTYYGDYNDRDPRSAEQLYQIAAESRNAHVRLHYYETLVEQYPDHELADESLFMFGFVSSEEFADVPQAAQAFRRLIREYPQSEFVDEAQWMMKNLGRTEPRLRGSQLPADADEAGTRIEGARN